MLQREESATSHIAVCRGDSQHGTATYQTRSWRVCAAEILAFRVRKQQKRGPKGSKQATLKPCRAQPCCGKKKQQSKSGRRPKVNKGIIRRQMLVAEEQSVVFFFFLKAAPALLDAQQHATWPHRAKRSAARWGAGWRGWLRYVLRTTRARCWRSEVEEGGKNGQRTTVRNLEKNVSLDVGRITPVTMTPWKTAFQGN